MRCMTLARALARRGTECAFVESRAAAPLLRRFGWPGLTLLAISDAKDLDGLLAYAAHVADLFKPGVIVVDHYGVGQALEARLRVDGRRLAVIDDLADRSHACDLLADPGYGRKTEAYRGLIPDDAAVLTGPAYALVRPEFAAARGRALSRRAKHMPVKRALISLGLTDLGGHTARLVRLILPALGSVRLDVVVGADAPSLPELTELAAADRRLHLSVDSDEMASLMADADIAIGAGGSSVWERAVVGLPSATVVLAANQRPMSERLVGAGMALAADVEAAGFEERLLEIWDSLVADSGLRWRLTERASELCDGHGAERLADAVLRL